MKAAVLRGPGEPLVLEDVPKPVPAGGQVLVRIRVSGVCHTDLHQWRGDWPAVSRAMEAHGVKILGHEGVGVVEEVGAGVTRLSRGDRVGVPWINYFCGACEHCLSGDPHWCVEAKQTSVHVDGTYAQYALINERAAPRIPSGLGDVEAAPLLCGGVTAYGAVRKLVAELGIPPSAKPVAVIGAAGGLGHYAVQVAKAFGYSVVGIDVGEERVRFVEKLGADHAVDAAEAEKFVEKRFGGVYASLVFAPKISGYTLGLRLLRPRGVLVVAGIPDTKEGGLPLVPLALVGRGTRIVPTNVGVTHEFEELFGLVVAGKVKSHVSKLAPLSEVNQVYRELEQARYVGRAVLEIA